jgi:L-ascorbate metabolism protein UlaG (beta-lactamase superfamily)
VSVTSYFSSSELSEEQLERLNRVDILLVPVGGKPGLSPEQAGVVIKQIEPKMVVPMSYATKGLKRRLAPVADFQKEVGARSVQEQDKLRIKKRDLTGEEMLFVILKRP